MIVRRVDTLIEEDVASFQGGTERPQVKTPLEPERKSPSISPPKRDPKPEPIKDPLYPPSPGTDPDEEPEPIGDPPDESDQPIRMGFMTAVCSGQWPTEYSVYRDRVSFNTHSHHKICDHHDTPERSSL